MEFPRGGITIRKSLSKEIAFRGQVSGALAHYQKSYHPEVHRSTDSGANSRILAGSACQERSRTEQESLARRSLGVMVRCGRLPSTRTTSLSIRQRSASWDLLKHPACAGYTG